MPTAPVTCPQCSSKLVEPDGEPPWCTKCEWNLGASPRLEDTWFWRAIGRLDHRAGFRADRLLAEKSFDGQRGRFNPGYLFLVIVSLVLLLAMVGALVGGVYLIVAHPRLPWIAIGIALIAASIVLRPRLGRLRNVLRGTWRLDPQKAPRLYALVHDVADRVGAPHPDIIALDLDANASAEVVGVRRTRVLTLGVPFLLAVRGQQLVALIGHELGHFHHQDSSRRLFVGPALTVFGALSSATRPPHGDAVDRGLDGITALVYTSWQIIGGAVSWLLFWVHITMHTFGGRDSRRAEVHADAMAARVAGTTGALGLMDTLALSDVLMRHIQPNAELGHSAATWRSLLVAVRDDYDTQLPTLRQHSIRQEASLLASHPAPGRRHQRLARQQYQDGSVVLTPGDIERIDTEVAPYAEALRKMMADHEG